MTNTKQKVFSWIDEYIDALNTVRKVKLRNRKPYPSPTLIGKTFGFTRQQGAKYLEKYKDDRKK